MSFFNVLKDRLKSHNSCRFKNMLAGLEGHKSKFFGGSSKILQKASSGDADADGVF